MTDKKQKRLPPPRLVIEDEPEYTITEVEQRQSFPVCGAKMRRSHGLCHHQAGFRTTHFGSGRCWLHGGLQATDNRVTHGRYSMVKSARLQSILEELADDSDPLDLVPDVEMLRAVFVDFINRYETTTEALLAWHQSYALKSFPSERIVSAMERVIAELDVNLNEDGEATANQTEDIEAARAFVAYYRTPDPTKPRLVMDLSECKNILSEVGRMVERVEKIRAANAISRPELNRIYQEMWRAVDALVASDSIKTEIKKSWLNIAL